MFSRQRGYAAALVLLVALAGCGDDKPEVKADEALKRGLAAQVAGDVDEALDEYEKTLKADPDNTFALYNVGLIRQNQGNAADAERNYRRVLEIDPNFSSAIFNLAILRNNAGAPQEAIALYRRVLAINPKDANAHLNLGFALKAIGQAAAGDRELAAAVALDPQLRSRIPARPSATPSSAASPGS